MATFEPKQGEIFSSEVRDLTSEGSGVVSHPSGRTFFVDGVWPGEKGQFRVTGLKGRIGFADIVQLEAVSPKRQDAPCPYHGHSSHHCGGCPWQFMAYDKQLMAKQSRIEKELARADVFEQIKTIWPSDQIFGYRNRTQLKSNGARVGYVSGGTNRLVAIEDCLVLSDKNRQTLAEIVARLPVAEWRPKRKNGWTTLDVDESVNAESLSVNKRLPFRQANSRQNERMRQWLSEKLIPLPTNSRVIELFCGSGNFTEVIAARGFREILAVEGASEAMDILNRKQLPNVTTLTCNLYDELGMQRVYHHGKKAEILILDPPRDGMKIKQPFLKKNNHLKEVFYISCNLSTFVRDVKDLMELGYKVVEVQPLDQAPHTPHIEVLCHLTRNSLTHPTPGSCPGQ